VQSSANQQAGEDTQEYTSKVQGLIAQLNNYDKHARDRAAIELGRSKNPLAVKPLISSLEDDHWGVRVHAAQALGELGFPDAVQALIETLLRDTEVNTVRAPAAEALGKIKDTRAIAALNLTLKDPSEFVRKAAHEALSKIRGNAHIPTSQISAHSPASHMPAPIPSKKSINVLLKNCPSSDGCYQLPVAEAANLLVHGQEDKFHPSRGWLPLEKAQYLYDIVPETTLSIGLSRLIAEEVEKSGYCVEPDARHGGGSYSWNQTLVLFKQDVDQIKASSSYLGAANLLRLCVLIAVADGQIDEVELDVFRQVIENQLDLTPTDHRRLQILEKLLVQNPSSAAKTLANIAKSVPVHKRLLIGKVLVRVAAADTVITKDERRALERIFKAFEISQDTLENLMIQACPPLEETVQKTSPVSIPLKPEAPKKTEAELTQKQKWDEWVALQERLAERQKKSLSGATNQKVETGEATAQHTAKQLQKKKIESSKVEQGQKMKEYVPATSQFLSKQDIRPATEKQLAYLNLFGFVPDRPLTIVEASALIEQFSGDPERQKVRDGNYVNQKLKDYDDLNTNQAFYMRNDIDEAKRELEKAEEDDTNDAEAIVDYVENVEYVRNCRLDFWADTFDLPVNIQYGTYRQCSVYEQKTKFYLANGYRFELPAPEQIQVVLDILDADSATWDKDMPESFFQTLEHSFPQLLRTDIDLEALAIEKKEAKDFLDGFRELHRESIIRLSALRSANFQTPRPAVGARPQYPDVSRNYDRPTKPEPLVQDAPKHFALDMVKVDSITNETREVVGILSDLMEDEPEAASTPSQRVEVSAPEVPQMSGGDKSAPQPSRFGGLNAAFIPILERLLTRDSWPQADFNALAREFQFMPLNIRDTLNEWSDEALGDFILDGENPVFVRRELMTKEKI
jgi:uncharacterized tellurite resistance protein B-like protein